MEKTFGAEWMSTSTIGMTGLRTPCDWIGISKHQMVPSDFLKGSLINFCSVWRGFSSWKDCSAAALLFSRLRPLSEVCTVECEPDTANGADYAALCDKENPFRLA